jgi:hypothetical protein
MTSSSDNDQPRATRQETKLEATDRAAREIIRTEADARRDLTARLKASRLKNEAGEKSSGK